MAERVTYTDLGFAAITPQELDALIAERDSLRKQIETWEEVNGQTVERANRFFADRAACRARLAALVESARLVQHEAWFGDWQAIEIGEVELVAARGWLAAHPEGA